MAALAEREHYVVVGVDCTPASGVLLRWADRQAMLIGARLVAVTGWRINLPGLDVASSAAEVETRTLHDIPGIKVDAGTTPLAGFPGELVTRGLDGMRERFAEYASLGARFAKWRGVLRIDDHRPTATCIQSNAHALARYAALAQEADLVPVVEPEVLMDGSHTIDRCAEVTADVLRAVYEQLARHRIVLEATLLKPNMILPGKDCPVQASTDEIADATIAVLRETVPAAVPGIVFLSGGQTDEQATSRLNALNRRTPQPWELSFSFGRALQGAVLRAWNGDDTNTSAGQAALLHRAAMNAAARHGTYQPDMESAEPPATAGGAAPAGNVLRSKPATAAR
jgi:fructose-bisphosphate aldolase, class I